MELTSLQHLILTVLSVQSDGYLCSPYASAFLAEGLQDPEEIEREMVVLQNAGAVEFYTIDESTDIIKVERDSEGNLVLDEDGAAKPILDDEGKLQIETLTQVVDSGWVITESGRQALNV